jgi:hypothetical protein
MGLRYKGDSLINHRTFPLVGIISHEERITLRQVFNLTTRIIIFSIILEVLPLPTALSHPLLPPPSPVILDDVHKTKIENIGSRYPYLIICGGDILYAQAYNATWHGNLHELHDEYTYSTYGYYYKTNIYLCNDGGMSLGLYWIRIRDRETRTLFTKSMLPDQFIIYNFTGFISLAYYAIPHGPFGCDCGIRGFAQSFGPYPSPK